MKFCKAKNNVFEKLILIFSRLIYIVFSHNRSIAQEEQPRNSVVVVQSTTNVTFVKRLFIQWRNWKLTDMSTINFVSSVKRVDELSGEVSLSLIDWLRIVMIKTSKGFEFGSQLSLWYRKLLI